MTPNIQAQLDALSAQVAATKGAEDSAEVLIEGFQARLDAAVAAATKNGASEAELAPLTDLSAALKASSDKLAADVAANPSP